jgi:pimeloyl-ACP methyl ester carboxylesterase
MVMLPPVCRSILICLALTFIAERDGAAFAQVAPAPALAEDIRLSPYAEAGQRVDVGGRHINLHCSGAGTPTVVLLAGLSSWSPVWYKSQPEIAKRTRVCAFDRASYGFSDPAPRPQILSEVPDDLHAALISANLPGPYVLVGHSLGGQEARLFAERWPHDVAGIVLVDTSPAAESLREAALPGYDASQEPERSASKDVGCALLAARGLDPFSPAYQDCVQVLPSDAPAVLRQVWPRFYTADYAAAKVSLISSTFTHRYDSGDSINLGDMPLVVLSADVGIGWNGPQGPFWRDNRSRWFALHEALSRLSSRGVHRVIPGAGHLIQLDEPQAIIDAVDEVLRKLPASSRSFSTFP